MNEMETVEQFLARGGQVNELPMGYTAFPDGKIPMAPKPRKTHIVETPSAVIEEKNKEIRTKKPRRESRPLMSEDEIKSLSQDQMKVLGEFHEKMFHGDKKRFCELCGISTKTLDNARTGNGRIGSERWGKIKIILAAFVFSQPKPKVKIKYKPKQTPEAQRRAQVTEARRKAQEEGKSIFTAPCKKHGMTKFYLHGNQPPRCAECRIETTKHHKELHMDAEQKCKNQRAQFNKDGVLKAVSDGADSFTGLCVRCGYTVFKFSKSPNTVIGYTYRCLECTRAAQLKYKESKK